MASDGSVGGAESPRTPPTGTAGSATPNPDTDRGFSGCVQYIASMLPGNTPFDTIMIFLPIWLPALVVGITIQWIVARSAAISALRKHARDQEKPEEQSQNTKAQ